MKELCCVLHRDAEVLSVFAALLAVFITTDTVFSFVVCSTGMRRC